MRRRVAGGRSAPDRRREVALRVGVRRSCRPACLVRTAAPADHARTPDEASRRTVRIARLTGVALVRDTERHPDGPSALQTARAVARVRCSLAIWTSRAATACASKSLRSGRGRARAVRPAPRGRRSARGRSSRRLARREQLAVDDRTACPTCASQLYRSWAARRARSRIASRSSGRRGHDRRDRLRDARRRRRVAHDAGARSPGRSAPSRADPRRRPGRRPRCSRTASAASCIDGSASSAGWP